MQKSIQQDFYLLSVMQKKWYRLARSTISHQSVLDKSLDGVLIDVREDHEWKQSYIPGAMHISKGLIEAKIESIVTDREKTLYLYCGAGFRSVLAAENLMKMGYSNVKSVNGGIRGWCQANLPLSQE